MIVWVSEISSRASRFWKRDEVLGPCLVARRPRPPRSRAAGGEAGELDVHVVGRAAHQPHGRLGDARDRPRLRRFRSSTERGSMWLMLIGSPVSGSGIRHSSAYGVLAVEHTGQGAGRTAQGGMCGDIVHTLTLKVQVPPRVA